MDLFFSAVNHAVSWLDYRRITCDTQKWRFIPCRRLFSLWLFGRYFTNAVKWNDKLFWCGKRWRILNCMEAVGLCCTRKCQMHWCLQTRYWFTSFTSGSLCCKHNDTLFYAEDRAVLELARRLVLCFDEQSAIMIDTDSPAALHLADM